MGPWDIGTCAALAAAMAAGLWRLRLRDPVGADEGYLWYGTLQTLAGKLPHRDFKSYEPGRYLWCAAHMAVFGARLPILRAAAHAFYLLGLFVALGSLRSLGLGWATLALGAVALGAWAFPQHKLFEPALAMGAFAALQALVRSPGPGTAAAGGLAVGLALVFGFNLFLYFGAALALILAWLLATNAASAQLLPWSLLGAAAAATPLLVPLVGSAAFRRAFIERRITAVLRRGTTNLRLPVPWPWCTAPPSLRALTPARRKAIGAVFLLLPALPWLWLVGLATNREVPSGDLGAAALAAAALGAFAWHHAFSRADVSHLAQSVVPVLLLLLLAAARSPHPPLLALLIVVASISLVAPIQPSAARRERPEAFALRELAGARITLTVEQRQLLDCVRLLRDVPGGAEGPLLAVPTLAWLYPMLGLSAPVYDIFGVWPATSQEQARMIDELERSRASIALVANSTLDGREDLRFSATHPEVWRYLQDRFGGVECASLPADVHLFRARAERGTGGGTPR